MFPVLLIAELAVSSTGQRTCSVSPRCLSRAFAVHLHKATAITDSELYILNIVPCNSRAQTVASDRVTNCNYQMSGSKYFSDFNSGHQVFKYSTAGSQHLQNICEPLFRGWLATFLYISWRGQVEKSYATITGDVYMHMYNTNTPTNSFLVL